MYLLDKSNLKENDTLDKRDYDNDNAVEAQI